MICKEWYQVALCMQDVSLALGCRRLTDQTNENSVGSKMGLDTNVDSRVLSWDLADGPLNSAGPDKRGCIRYNVFMQGMQARSTSEPSPQYAWLDTTIALANMLLLSMPLSMPLTWVFLNQLLPLFPFCKHMHQDSEEYSHYRVH